ncbi:MAG: hypothetical protein M3R07_06735 [Gemmatimonadota bacterium]|nr:hypothetical protein [Gemmatimonadota bacterium]
MNVSTGGGAVASGTELSAGFAGTVTSGGAESRIPVVIESLAAEVSVEAGGLSATVQAAKDPINRAEASRKPGIGCFWMV